MAKNPNELNNQPQVGQTVVPTTQPDPMEVVDVDDYSDDAPVVTQNQPDIIDVDDFAFTDEEEATQKNRAMRMSDPNAQFMPLTIRNRANEHAVLTSVSTYINNNPQNKSQSIQFPTASDGRYTKPDAIIEMTKVNKPNQRGVNISVRKTDPSVVTPTKKEWVAYFNDAQRQKELAGNLSGPTAPAQIEAFINPHNKKVQFGAIMADGTRRGLTESEIEKLAGPVGTMMQQRMNNACVYKHNEGEGVALDKLISKTEEQLTEKAEETQSAVQPYESNDDENDENSDPAMNPHPNVNVGERLNEINEMKIKNEGDSVEIFSIKLNGGKVEYQVESVDENNVPSVKTLSENEPGDAKALQQLKGMVSQIMTVDNKTFNQFKEANKRKTIENAVKWLAKNEVKATPLMTTQKTNGLPSNPQRSRADVVNELATKTVKRHDANSKQIASDENSTIKSSTKTLRN